MRIITPGKLPDALLPRQATCGGCGTLFEFLPHEADLRETTCPEAKPVEEGGEAVAATVKDWEARRALTVACPLCRQLVVVKE